MKEQSADHVEVRWLVGRLMDILGKDPSVFGPDLWRFELDQALHSLRARLETHFELEERSPIYSGGPQFARFENDLTRLLAQHRDLLEEIDELAEVARTEPIGEVAARADALAATVELHERTENEILQGALTSDLDETT